MATVSLHSPTALPHTLWSGTVRLLRSGARDAVANMAVDEAMLLTAAETGETFVRLYRWDRPSVSFGRNQRSDGIYSSERCQALDVPAVRRLTGGRALLHGREITYAVAAPTSVASTLRGGYEAINDLLIAALRGLGVAAERAVVTRRTPAPGLAPCFETPSAGELVVGGAKLVGSAQHRDARSFLQHGSILLDDDQGLLRALALVPLPPVPAPATVARVRPDLDGAAIEGAIVAAVRAAATGAVVEMTDADLPPQHVDLATSRYRDSRWTWRR